MGKRGLSEGFLGEFWACCADTAVRYCVTVWGAHKSVLFLVPLRHSIIERDRAFTVLFIKWQIIILS